MKCRFFLVVQVQHDTHGKSIGVKATNVYQNRPNSDAMGTSLEVELELPLEILEPKVTGTIDIADIAQTIADLKHTAAELGITST